MNRLFTCLAAAAMSGPAGAAAAVTPTAGKPSVVSIDERNRLVVNREPFFPIGFFLGPNDDENLARIAATGYNTVLCYAYGREGKQPVAFLDRALRHGLWVIYSLKDHYKHHRGFPKDRYRNGPEMARKVHVPLLREHPALLAWYINDEEWPSSTRKGQLLAMRNMLAEMDPNHPTLSVINKPHRAAFYVETTDILAPDPYPVPDRPLTMVSTWMRLCNEAVRGQKPVWAVPQIFARGIYSARVPHSPVNVTGREPTFAEKRCMTYQTLVHRAQGLIYYSYADLFRRRGRQNEDELMFQRKWADMRCIGHELTQLVPALLHGGDWDFDHSPLEPFFEFRGIEYEDRLYVLIANPNPVHQASHFKVELSKGQWRLKGTLGGDVMATCKDGRNLEIMIGPYGADTVIVERAK